MATSVWLSPVGLRSFSTIGVKLGFCGLKLGADDYIIDADYPIETYF
jgi:hypothetical protein